MMTRMPPLGAEDPDICLEEILTDNSLPLFEHVYTHSREELSGINSWGGLARNDQLRSTPSLSRTKLIQQLEAMHPLLAIDAPIRISQAQDDPRVDAGLTGVLAFRLKGIRGNKVDYVPPYATVAPTTGKFERLGIHFGLLDTDRGPLVAWLGQRFDSSS